MKRFFWKDKTGRGVTNTFTTEDILTWDDEDEYDVEELHDWAESADAGDEWECRTMKLTCIESE